MLRFWKTSHTCGIRENRWGREADARMLTREKPRKILGPAHPLRTPLDSTAEGLRAGTRGREPQRPLLSTRGCDDTDGLLSEDSQAQTLSTGSSA